MVISYCKIIPKRTFHIPVKMAVGNVNPNTKKKIGISTRMHTPSKNWKKNGLCILYNCY